MSEETIRVFKLSIGGVLLQLGAALQRVNLG
jgi:hypothetical protein